MGNFLASKSRLTLVSLCTAVAIALLVTINSWKDVSSSTDLFPELDALADGFIAFWFAFAVAAALLTAARVHSGYGESDSSESSATPDIKEMRRIESNNYLVATPLRVTSDGIRDSAPNSFSSSALSVSPFCVPVGLLAGFAIAEFSDNAVAYQLGFLATTILCSVLVALVVRSRSRVDGTR